jgi:hypothetical protein
MQNAEIAAEIRAAELKLKRLRAQMAEPKWLTGWWIRDKSNAAFGIFLGSELRTKGNSFQTADGTWKYQSVTNNGCVIYWGTFPAQASI